MLARQRIVCVLGPSRQHHRRRRCWCRAQDVRRPKGEGVARLQRESGLQDVGRELCRHWERDKVEGCGRWGRREERREEKGRKEEEEINRSTRRPRRQCSVHGRCSDNRCIFLNGLCLIKKSNLTQTVPKRWYCNNVEAVSTVKRFVCSLATLNHSKDVDFSFLRETDRTHDFF